MAIDYEEAAMRLKYYALHDVSSVYISEAIYTAIDALQNEKVERGQWMAFKDEQGYVGDLMRCSSCNFVFDNYSGIFNYCPSCGKEMRVGEANEHR